VVLLQKELHPERLRSAAFVESIKETGEFLSYPTRPQDEEARAELDDVVEVDVPTELGEVAVIIKLVLDGTLEVEEVAQDGT
jgi:hypothetical protein